jgi:8-oxo-dGTP pyrophosphatase MutT (NUDIX family)
MPQITLLKAPDPIAKPGLAATVVLLRDSDHGPEAFLLRRKLDASFMPGAYVFPGGMVDPTDADLAPGQTSPAFFVAAVRETFEEAGILLAVDGAGELADLSEGADAWVDARRAVAADSAQFRCLLDDRGLRLATDYVKPWSWWLTPVIEKRRFDTRFFVARMPQRQEPRHDGDETTTSRWMPVRYALEGYRDGALDMAPPTLATLLEMSDCADVDAVLACAPFDEALRFPFFAKDDAGRVVILMPGDDDYPADQPPVQGSTRFTLDDGRWWTR